MNEAKPEGVFGSLYMYGASKLRLSRLVCPAAATQPAPRRHSRDRRRPSRSSGREKVRRRRRGPARRGRNMRHALVLRRRPGEAPEPVRGGAEEPADGRDEQDVAAAAAAAAVPPHRCCGRSGAAPLGDVVGAGTVPPQHHHHHQCDCVLSVSLFSLGKPVY